MNEKLFYFCRNNTSGVRCYLLIIGVVWMLSSCRQVMVNEKQVSIPQHEWKKIQKAVVKFDIQDSLHHQLYFVVRHTQQFPFNKLLLTLSIQDASKRTLVSMNIGAPLTDAHNNWNGTAMDDIYYNRIKINPKVFLCPGVYRFVLQHRMKEEVLPHILNVGIAIDQ